MHPVTATPAGMRACTEDVMTRYEQNEQRGLVAEIAEAIAERRWPAFGLESGLWAGTVATRLRFPLPPRPGA
jgi:hypothetical protein